MADNPTPPSGAGISSRMEGIALWDDVKKRIWEKSQKAAELLRRIQKDKAENRETRDETEFISAVLYLWFDLYPKANRDYAGTEEKQFEKLKEPEYRKFAENPRSFTLHEALDRFFIMRTFIERLGITRFEQEKLAPEEEMFEGLEDG